MRKTTAVFTALSIMALVSAPARAQFGDILQILRGDQPGGSLSNATIADGLKETLHVGTSNAVRSTGRLDGYFGNEAIRILLPERFQTVERGLRLVGYGHKVDEFVLSMNRAAEQAAPFAADIFWDAIRTMSFADAHGILKGGDTAATDYFRRETSEELVAAFQPIVRESMDSVGVTRQYRELSESLAVIPFGSDNSAFNLEEYVVDKALDGLFHVLAEEETKIRRDPAARVTELLRNVFGSAE